VETNERLLSIKEASEVLGVSTDWIYRNQRYKTLPFTIILSPRKIRFSLQGLLEWLKEQRNGRQGVQEEGHVPHSV
jgi:excisionase family DNA binding protein